ncbi:S-layer homology domain-containing protein [Paenibacillus sp. FSL H8-0548]|uniref:S-layer homology domain-containing protein n=1 Tax=Paenibacillus sp. FSL H8-0548 TaxID=1920422 RepID=UPI0009FA8BB9|nr:S-layer homology domain-containing protein [Paenibacillus sp. FSL H8-0548]
MREKSNSLFKQNSQQPNVFRGGEIKVMKKKIAAFVLAAALVLPTSLTAFAATPSDVVGKPVQSAVEELTALGIITGYEDGTFKPDNTITRAELAKIIVIGSGNEGAANLMQTVKPTFKDVKANVWYTGYINAAATKGFIQGYNGNFRPSDPVKFEEVVAVLVRSLGYQENKLSGVWPYNVLLKAQDINLFDGVNLNVGGQAVRGVVAQLTSNTLNAKLVSYNADGNEVLSSSTLISKLGNTSSAELLGAALVDGKVTLRWVDGKDTNGVEIVKNESVATATNFIVTGGKSLVDLVGHNVTVVKNKAGQVLAITDAQATGDIVTGKIDGVQTAGTVKIKDKTAYATVSNSVYFVNNVTVASLGSAADKDEVTLFLDNGKVRAAVVAQWSQKDALVTSVEAKNNYREARLNTNGKNGDESVFVTDATSVTLDGKVAALADLKADDTVRVIQASGKASKVEAVRSVTNGKLESIGTSNGTAKYTISGKVYDASGDVKAGNIDTLIAANIGKEFTLVLNKDGAIVKAKAPEAAVNTPFAIITNVDNDVWALDGSKLVNKQEVTYYNIKDNKSVSVQTDKYVVAPAAGYDFAAHEGKVVELDINSDGKLVGLTATTKLAVDGAGSVVDAVSASDIKVGNVTHLLSTNTVVVNVSKLDETKPADRVLTTEAIAKVTKGDLVYVYAKDGVNANFILLVTDTDGVSDKKDNVHGLFVEAIKNQLTTTSSTYAVKLNVAGEVKTFDTTGSAYETLVATATKAVENDIITLTDTDLTNTLYDNSFINKTYYSDAEQAVVVPSAITETSSVAGNTFTVGNDKYIVSGKTNVYVIAKDGTLYTGNYVDVKNLTGATINTANGTVADVKIANSGTNLGAYQEAAVIVIKLKS